ncbi:alpha/beta fold hydrolase [Halopseudomonas laoshanensis]|uniref:alpha/beta fold hydrolase n=1 Tax=Halopseudomonas laoshanensis TaxID=2268758 RepID=UPI001B3D81A5|nr:alpha/beta fold hydrolase [Pseudomonas sp.]
MNTNLPRISSAWRLAGLPLLSLVAAMSAGCFSGSGSSSSSDESSDVQQGIFVDSPVAGLRYETPSQEGETNETGRFQYREGEIVSFHLGELKLGEGKGESIMTPTSLVTDAADSSDPAVLNISRLLQTLDADGNLNNGIELTDAIVNQIDQYLTDNPGTSIDFADTAAFDSALASLLAALNETAVFAENADGKSRVARSTLQAWQHLQDSLDALDGRDIHYDVRPVVFIHGGAGSASQFESQAQRFIANGYPRDYLATFEYDTSAIDSDDYLAMTDARNAGIDAIIDQLLAISGADKVDLMGHSNGTRVSLTYLSDPQRAAKVANYVSIDGTPAASPPGGVRTLALWGQYIDREVVGAENVYPPVEAPVGHIEVATSASSFERMYAFFNAQSPAVSQVPQAEGADVWVAGRASIFPRNIGAEGAELRINEISPDTGARLSDTPSYQMVLDSSGQWGPARLNKGGSYEFALVREGAGNDHYFYREPFTTDSYNVRLNTSLPGSGVGALLTRSANHSNIGISRDKEFWGYLEEGSDSLEVKGTNVITEQTAPLLKRLSSLFLHDRGADGVSNLGAPDPVLNRIPFISGLDMYLPAAGGPNGVISLELTPRGEEGSHTTQIVNVPNWPSDQIRTISVHFKDYVD